MTYDHLLLCQAQYAKLDGLQARLLPWEEWWDKAR
jgi:hypothetical protein